MLVMTYAKKQSFLLHFVVNFSIKEITAELSALEQVKLQSTTMYFVLLNWQERLKSYSQ